MTTKAALKTAYLNVVQDTDPTMSTQGPLGDFVIDPITNLLALSVDATDRAGQLLSGEFAAVATPEEALAFANNFGVGQSVGRFATGTQVFYRNSRPPVNTTFSVPAGTIVRRKGDGYRFQVLPNNVTLSSDSAAFNYVASRARYEISVPVQAVSVGEAYNTAAELINAFETAAPGFDGTINLESISGGQAAEDASSTVSRARVSMFGTDSGTHGGIVRQVVSADSDVLDVALVFSDELDLFHRPALRAGIDVYVLGRRLRTYTDSFYATLGQQTFTLAKPPVVSVASVKRNGVSVAYTFSQDVSSLKASYLAQDKVVLASPANSGDAIEVTYAYDDVVRTVQESVLTAGTTSAGFRRSLWNVDMLVRLPVEVQIEVTLQVRLQTTVNRSTVIAALEAVVYDYCTPTAFAGALYPSTLLQNIREGVSGVQSVKLVKFKPKRTPFEYDVGPIMLERNQVPVFAFTSDLEVLGV